MADAVASQTIVDGPRNAVMKFTNVSDGTGEATVLKVDVSALAAQPRTGLACTGVDIERVYYTTAGMSVNVLWDATANVVAWTLNGDGYLDFRGVGSLTNNAGAGVTGDVLFTTAGATAGDVYSILLVMTKKYG